MRLPLNVILLAASASLAAPASMAAAVPLPPPDSPAFCVAVQKILASTELNGTNTLFTDMPSYRHSKPSAKPLNIYQVVTYRGREPVMVSCKVKTAANLRAVYGERAAGRQLTCPDLTGMIRSEAVTQLRRENQPEAAARAAAFVLDDNEPYITGSSYLADFKLSYRDAEGKVHITSFGLFQNYDSWITRFLPEKFQGQNYCHLATVGYIKSLATGARQPGDIMTTAEDAPVTPR